MKIIRFLFVAIATLLCSVSVNAENIEFADAKVKELCVANWDTNGDGELSTIEAANVADLGKVFYSKEITSFDELQYFTGLKSIGEEAFCLCLNLTSIVLPENIETIGKYAFQRCESLSGLVIPSNVQTIEYGAFIDCIKLESIVIPEKVKSIGARAFSYCEKLSNVTMGNAVTEIGDYAFYLCKMSEITLPNNLTTIGNEAFGVCTNLKAIDIPNSVTNLGEGVFAVCKSLMSVNIGKGVTSLSERLFENCTALESITIPRNVIYIGDKAFNSCSNLKTVINKSRLNFIKGSVEHGLVAYYADEVINSFVFEIVDGVNTLVQYIRDLAEVRTNFNNWTSTNKGTSSSVSSNTYTFDVVAGEKLNFDWSVSSEANYDKLIITLDGTVILNKSGVYSGNYAKTFTEAGSHTLLVEYTKDYSVNNNDDEAKICNIYTTKNEEVAVEEAIILPESYNGESYVIGEEVFYNYSKMTGIKIPNKVIGIGDRSFYGCTGLTSIEIPNKVENIGNQAFFGCSGLTALYIPSSVNDIESAAFGNCINVNSIVVDDLNSYYDSRENSNAIIESKTNTLHTGCKNTIIPNSVVRIGRTAFSNCWSLTSIVIPNTVTNIDAWAFLNCINLTSIEIPSSVETIGEFAFYQCESLTSLVIPKGVKTIESSAFSYCTNLQSVDIAYSVTNIGNAVFSYCSDLISVTVGNNAPVAINEYTFDNRTNATLYVPAGSKAAYEAADYWKEFKEIVELSPTSVTITINQYGSSTYCSEYALDFTNVEGLKAYVATGYNTRTGVVTMTRVMTTKDGTGLFLKGEQGSYEVPIIAESDDNTLNLLVGTLTKVTVNSKDDTYTNYKFTVKAGETEPGFYNFADNSTLSANKAYLHIPTAWLPSTSAAKSVRMWFEDEEATGIDEINTNRPDSYTIYDMQGRRIKNPSKGMYIVNGKKMIIK